MAIETEFDIPPTPPSSTDKTNFRVRYDAFLAYIVALVGKLIIFVQEINILSDNINAKEASATASAAVCTYFANFKGTWTNQTTAIGESWDFNGKRYGVLVSGNTSPIVSPSNWVNLGIEAQIHNSGIKVTPVDADEFPILDNISSFGLKKFTWANLKTGLKAYFDTLYAGLASPAFTGTPTAKNFAYKQTPVTIMSWSYVGTTITLNVASHTFVAGDYIEVGRLTATSNIPNGVHLVTSVTATTILFTYALTPTGTAGVSSATVKGYMTTNGRVEGIGVGQTWQVAELTNTGALFTDGTPKYRVAGATYTNNTGKPINVEISPSSAGGETNFTVDGVYISKGTARMSIIVPSGSTYSAPLVAGGIWVWSELR